MKLANVNLKNKEQRVVHEKWEKFLCVLIQQYIIMLMYFKSLCNFFYSQISTRVYFYPSLLYIPLHYAFKMPEESLHGYY